MSTMTFQPVNSSTTQQDRSRDFQDDSNTPSTPRARATQILANQDVAGNGQHLATTIVTATTPNLPGQKPLPTSPFAIPSDTETKLSMLQRGGSNNSGQSSRNVEDMDVDGSDDDQDGSDNDTENGEPGRSSKKKKGQRFFCTDFPPCNLSFTRSEHLARHIRKHTGERPFQCHCNRRFSRLDNLRQHAQTVHVNEDIPAESLAATGTRYQRQIRTEKLRPAGSRARSGTLGSQGGHSRGHSRNLSASSIGSTTSNYSTAETRRRPPPLLMATDGSARPPLTLERPSTPPSHYRGYSANSPGGMTTPTSATYSANPDSPGYGSFMESPVSGTSRMAGYYGTRTPGRRLSVPSSANAFQSPHGHTQPHPYMSPLASSNSNFSNNPSNFASPTSSQFSYSRMESGISPAEAELRRRTWHPSSYATAGFNYSRPATSGLSFSQTPDTLQPALTPHATAAAAQAPRLPGIESFDQVQHRPSTPPRRQPSPMQIDTPSQPSSFAAHSTFQRPTPPISDHRRGHFSWDGSHQGPFTRPDLQTNLSKDATSWGQQTLSEINNAASRPAIQNTSATTYRPGVTIIQNEPPRHTEGEPFQPHPTTPQRNKRLGWYNGPPSNSRQGNQLARTSPEDSSSSEGVPTPGTSAAEVHPAIMHSNGYIEPHHPVLPVEAHPNVSEADPYESRH
jgi:C2H2 transcription facotor